MLKLDIKSEITEEQLLCAIDSLDDNEKADFAIRFGEGGDINYELILLNKLISKINKIYSSNDKSDIEMSNLSKSLLALKPTIDKLIG